MESTQEKSIYCYCGSAGSCAILWQQLSAKLHSNKLDALHGCGAEIIATANIGCLLHQQSGTQSTLK